MAFSKKDKFNPFFMIGSYIGLFLGFLGSYFSFAAVFALAEEGKFTSPALLIPLIPAITGFLAGWEVHAIIKNARK